MVYALCLHVFSDSVKEIYYRNPLYVRPRIIRNDSHSETVQ